MEVSMKMRNLGVMATLGVLAAVGFTRLALADCPVLLPPSSPMIEFDADCWSYETSYTSAGFNSNPGSTLTIVGIVSKFDAPLAFLNASDPSKEYTFVATGLISAGTVAVNPFGTTWYYTTAYAGGSFVIYEGTPRNAPTAANIASNPPGGATVPANFQDGTPILTGDLCGFNTSISQTGTGLPNGNFGATYHFTNPNAPGAPPPGNLYNLMGGAEASFGGNWCVTSGGCTPPGYSAHPNGKWDSPPSTPTKKSTWGTLKTLYR